MPQPARKGAYRQLKPPAAPTRREWAAFRREVFTRNVTCAAAIRYCRIDAGVTQAEVARELGISVATVTTRESGRVYVDGIRMRAHLAAVDRAVRRQSKGGRS